jgi:hypothetical protein
MKLWPFHVKRQFVAERPVITREQEKLLQHNSEGRIKLALANGDADEVINSLTQLHERQLSILGRKH